jgi:UDP-N-acetylmuramyl pentapeptide phosphotransferase/UDP-N-acetylglucosamine-1-phosphate transferase
MSQFWLIAVLSVFVVAVVFSGVLIPQILLIAFKKRLFDHVDGRKIHHGTVPRLGGMAFMPVVILSVSLLLGVTLVFDSTEVLMCLVSDMKSIAFLTSAVIVIYLLTKQSVVYVVNGGHVHVGATKTLIIHNTVKFV